MRILAIETSCDDTSVAVVDAKPGKIKVLSNVISSQIKLHAEYGGVVPHLAAREHAKNIGWVFDAALKESKLKMKDIDLMAVTAGPGLIVSLVIGTTFAKTVAVKYEKPLLPVNHIEGHIYSNFIDKKLDAKKMLPILCLTVAGGHTQLVLMRSHGRYELIGETLDDAAGEAFDKIARLLGLGYPGGPIISKYAELGDPNAYPLPRPMLKHKNFDFSFSGLKTATLYLVRDLTIGGKKLTLQQKRDIAASAQAAIVEVLVTKTIKAAQQHKAKLITLSGGVSANRQLREALTREAKRNKIQLIIPPMSYTTDNAAMIAAAAYYNVLKNKKAKNSSWRKVEANANWDIA